ncbi:nucleotide-diphospho-sugar transferase [Lipomyces japonicus]|uniref:nucleotide-diphospho-sugar transferase n=1 Tax=Lipomyces japonicus TaxID=56871 RepID=UPI0034CF7EED
MTAYLQPTKALQPFAYEPQLQPKFTRYIWQTWKYLPNDLRFSAKFHRISLSWEKLNPDYAHEVLDDATSATLIRQLYASVPDVVTAYSTMPRSILKADFFRYLILFARGGVYSDIDTVPLKPIYRWISDGLQYEANIGLVVGIEADPDRPDWNDWYARRVQFCQWTIFAKKGHPVLRNIVSHITTETLRRKALGKLALPKTKESGSQIMDWTGPGIWTDTVFDYLTSIEKYTTWKNLTGITKGVIIGDVAVLPITSFSPGVNTMGAHQTDHPHAFVQHNFEGSWKPADERNVG